MPTITNSATLTLGAASVEFSEVVVTVLPPVGPEVLGTGRLIHPTLGTLDYDYSPTQWENIDTDVIVSPVWASSKTLSGASNALWAGSIRDVLCVERWGSDAGELRMPISMLRTMIAFYTSPPNPDVDQVLWYPSYTSPLGFKVALVGLTVGGQGVTLNWLTRKGWAATGDVVLSLRILGRVT